jgi:hypothetical protein
LSFFKQRLVRLLFLFVLREGEFAIAPRDATKTPAQAACCSRGETKKDVFSPKKVAPLICKLQPDSRRDKEMCLSFAARNFGGRVNFRAPLGKKSGGVWRKKM